VILYADTSSLVKLYLVEERSVEIRQSSLAADEVICSKITYAETRVAFARALRDQRINQTEFESARRKFDFEWADLGAVEVSDRILRRAGDLGDQYPIRGFDAIHLSSAIEIRDQRTASQLQSRPRIVSCVTRRSLRDSWLPPRPAFRHTRSRLWR
jgi:predicted nucleic acid-binding protein